MIINNVYFCVKIRKYIKKYNQHTRMASKRIPYCILILLSCSLLTQAQNKRALLVGISQYGNNTGWKNIHGANDVDLMKSVLKGFSIRELKNANATYDNIIKELNYLTTAVRLKSGACGLTY